VEISTMAGIAVVLAVLAVAIGVVILRKIGQIDLATRALAVHSQAIHADTEPLFQQIQALLALERKLDLREALPPVRGWAGSPDFLLFVAQEIQRRRPGTMVECGSGVSTLVCARMLQKSGRGRIYSLEHEPIYAGNTRRLLTEYGLSDWATVVDAPLDMQRPGGPWYSLGELPSSLGAIDMLIVDGPPSSVASVARYPALPALSARFAPNVAVIADDTRREDEREMLRLWESEFPQFTQHDAGCEKGCTILIRTSTDPGRALHG